MSKTIVCSSSPTSGLHCVEDRADIAFFAGRPDDLIDPETIQYFDQARGFFKEHLPTVIQSDAIDLYDIIETLNKEKKRGKLPWGEIYIVAHANPVRWFMRSGSSLPAQTRPEMMALRDAQRGGTFPAIKRNFEVVDPFSKVIIKACQIGRNVGMLDVISDVFGEWPAVFAPRFSLYFRQNNGERVERLFRTIELACIPGYDRHAPLSANERELVVEQLAQRYPSVARAEVEKLVSSANAEWKSGRNQTEWTTVWNSTEVSNPVDMVVNARDSGELYIIRSGTEIPLRTVTDKDMPRKAKEAFAEVFAMMNAGKSYGDLKYWKSSIKTEAHAGNAEHSKYYRLSSNVTATEVTYHQLVRDTAGQPAVPDVSHPKHYGRSTWDSRVQGYYRTSDAGGSKTK
jgi:hypothetical protein